MSSMLTEQIPAACAISAAHDGGHGDGQAPHAEITASKSSILTTPSRLTSPVLTTLSVTALEAYAVRITAGEVNDGTIVASNLPITLPAVRIVKLLLKTG